MRSRSSLGSILLVALVTLPACAGARPSPEVPSSAASAPEPPRADAATAPARDVRPTNVIATSGRVSLSAFALAGRVSWQGMRTIGRAAAGLFASGAGAAERGFRAGAKDTRAVARHEADLVKQSARVADE
jgi:hypothetical protein